MCCQIDFACLLSGLISGIIADDAVTSTPYSVTVTAADNNGQSVSQTFNWIVNDAPFTVQASPVSAVEGVDPGTLTLATFTTPDIISDAGEYIALVNWGDGSSDYAAISGGNGSFSVQDDHIYTEKDSYAISVTIMDMSGFSTTVTSTATVTDAALTLTGGFQFGVIHGQPATLSLGTFTDANTAAPASDYSATIDWGDNSGPPTNGTITSVDGLYTISGTHTYSTNGTYTVTLALTDLDGSQKTATSTVVVGDLIAGQSASLTVVSFSDPNTNPSLSEYTASIDWGDGTPATPGTVTSANGNFDVSGSHTYTQDSFDQPGGVYQVTVSITNDDGLNLTKTMPVEVVRPELPLSVANVDIGASHSVSNVQIATFTDSSISDAAGEFTAQVDWGDGNTSSGTIQELSPGLFEVLGSHTYAAAGWYTIKVEISQGWNTQEPAAVGAGQAGNRPVIVFRTMTSDGRFPQVDSLYVSKWEDAFNRGWLGPSFTTLVNPYFIDRDPYHFDVYVVDGSAAAIAKTSIQVNISTSSDRGNAIILKQKGNTGTFSSSAIGGSGWLLLTSVPVDDQYQANFVTDHNVGDPTFLVRLGDAVTASYGGASATATVPIQKMVNLHINDLRTTPGGNTLSATHAKVQEDVQLVNMIYAQVGILFKIEGQIDDVNPPTTNGVRVNLDNGLEENDPNSAQERALLGAQTLRTPADDDIEVYYVNYLTNDGSIAAGDPSVSFRASQVPQQYADSIIINSRKEVYMTLAHEIGHILMDSGAHPDGNVGTNKVNLMAVPYLVARWVTDSRRISEEQATAMLTKRPNLLQDP